MKPPFFSIVIPTRNRYETLRHTMRTVLSQNFDSFELIISDNSDEVNLPRKEMIEEPLGDARVKYFRTPSLLSMTDSWEFAIDKAQGDYLILFGDDDGLVSGALERLHKIIQETRMEVVSWTRVEYSWPDRAPVEVYGNLMVIPYTGRTGLIDGRKYMKDIIWHKYDYRLLPMFYNSAISRKLKDRLKEKVGRVFNASSPDVFTGYAFAFMLGKYLTIGHPLSINGVSSKSNGAVHDNHDKLKEEHWRLLKISAIKWPAELPEFYTAYLGIVEPYIQLTRFFPEIKGWISRKKIYEIIIDHLESSSPEDLEKKKEIIVETAKDDPSLQKWAAAYIEKVNPVFVPALQTGYGQRIGFNGSHLVLDGSHFGLANVYDVSLFIGHLFGEMKNNHYGNEIFPSLVRRAKRAAGIVLRKYSV